LNFAPTENFATFVAGTVIVSPVRGLRAVRSDRADWENAPKPGSVT
jgi:hypothetical protein